MRSWMLSALKQKFIDAEPIAFHTQHPHDWLVWEPGAWAPPATVTFSGPLSLQPPSKVGEALAIALEPKAAPMVLGREAADVTINDGTLSQRHLQLTCADGKWFVSDLGSRNGSVLNGFKLSTAPVALTSGAQLKVAQVFLTFYSGTGFLARLQSRR